MRAATGDSAGIAGDLVSVVIPCYNQVRYLPDAVSSAFAQSYEPVEVIVVDDGSSEDVRAVAQAWPRVEYVRQSNRGVSAARNTGFLHSHGGYVVFLDSDDRLASRGILYGLQALTADPAAGAAVGLCRVIGPDGGARPFKQQAVVDEDPYLELLRGNFVWMPGQVLFRRYAFAWTGGFDTTVDACADYDLYLRLARACRLAIHRCVVAEYRQHDANMSGDAALMMRSALHVLDRQRPYTRGSVRHQEALAAGRRFWRTFYGDMIVEQMRSRARTPGSRARVLPAAMMLLRYHPAGFLTHVFRKLSRTAGALLRLRPLE